MTSPPPGGPPAPRTRTVADVAAPYGNFLVPVPPTAGDVCAVCHGPVEPPYTTCYPCSQARRVLGDAVADVVAAVSLAPTGGQLAHELYTYKRASVPDQLRLPRLTGLAAVLWLWLHHHERCMAMAAGFDGEAFDIITTVPSLSGRTGQHPLVHLVAGVVSTSADRYQHTLPVNRADLDQRAFAADRYAAGVDVRGHSVLLVDDTWTTGAHAQSASAALRHAGATAVGILAIGRWITTDYRANAAWLAAHRSPGWQWEQCCLSP